MRGARWLAVLVFAAAAALPAGAAAQASSDLDGDGIADAADPCPGEPRNLCVGEVAVDGATGLPIRLNANVSSAECAGAKTDCNGDVWAADFGYNQAARAASCNLAGGGEGCVIGGIAALFGCEDEATEDLFQCEHSDGPALPELLYSFDVPNGRYLVNLFFANTYDQTAGLGDRVFDVSVEGQVVLSAFDQVAAAGGSGLAVLRSIDAVVADGDGLQVELLHRKENPAVKAIEVLRFGCTTAADCDDQDPCTDDLCTEGVCDYAANAAPCDDGLPCTTGDVCAGGVCSGVEDCPPGQACNPDTGSCGSLQIGFGKGYLQGAALDHPTSLQFGPDGRLYVAQQDGLLVVFDVARTAPGEYVATASEAVTLIRDLPNHDDDGSPNLSLDERLVTGIAVAGTASHPVVYVSSSDPRIGGGSSGTDKNLDTNSGVISRLTWDGTGWEKLDLVRGLPRSEENHAPNGMVVDEAAGVLYLAQGGNTNMGAPSFNLALLPEFALSAAILAIDLAAIGDETYDLPTLDDEDRAGDPDANDPFGGNDGKNQAVLVPGGPVQVYAPGFRNAYDLVVTGAGRMYTVDNGANSAWGDVPAGEGTASCTNAASEPGVSALDTLHFVDGPGYYGGHPNPTRANTANTFNASAPQSPAPGANPVECDYRLRGTEDGALATFKESTNGLTEYTAANFGGQMAGDLLAAGFNNKVFRIRLGPGGDTAEEVSVLFSSVGQKPLDVVALGPYDPFPGKVWVADWSTGQILVYEPADATFCTGEDSAGLDEDGDGYENADEIANGTDPCSPGDTPEDADGDFVSNLLDPDDDEDGLLDTSDPFARDIHDGTTTELPVLLHWTDGDAASGILDLGFTGLMTNGVDDYEALFDPAAMTAGGAAGVLTLDAVTEGDALGAHNDQELAFQLGVSVPPSAFTVHTRIVAPFFGTTPEEFQSMGLFVGDGTQDGYLKIVVAASGGGAVETLREVDGVPEPLASDALAMPGPDAVDLYLTVDPATASVSAAYAVEAGGAVGPLLALGAPAPVPEQWLSNPSRGLAIGILATSRGPAPEIAATWDLLEAFSGGAACASALDCDDGDACTDDACAAGACEHALNTAPCDDGVACTGPDACDAGTCSGADSCTPPQACNFATGACEGGARVPMTLEDFVLPGTQIGDVALDAIDTSASCAGCHGPYDVENDPFSTWSGSLMAQAGRDPLFFAQMTTANQDVSNVGYYCLRCHVPMSFVTGHAHDADGSTLDATDRDGITCHFCHAMVDPIYEPGVSPAEDEAVLAQLEAVPSFYGNAMFVLDPTGARRGPYADAQAPHEWIASPFHRSGDMCGTCHDVGNVAITEQPDGTYRYNAIDEATPIEDPHGQFPLERTYTEWKLSAFAAGGVDMGGRFGGEGATVVETCQDCHMPAATAAGCAWTDERPDLARHEFAGGGAPVLDLIAELHRGDPEVDGEAIARARAASVAMLERAATLELQQSGDSLSVRVVNESGHKLPTGHIEGRRVWIHVRFSGAGGAPLAEHGAYDAEEATLDEASTTVFEMIVGLSQDAALATGLPAGPTGHMSLADTIVKDNRIPPRGFDNAAFAEGGAPAVGEAYADGQHWHDSAYPIPAGAVSADVTLYYQNTPRAYVEHLRDANVTDHWGDTLFDLWVATGKGAPVAMQSARLALAEPCEAAAACDDADPCTDDACVAGLCAHAPNAATCDDGDACTGPDLCAGGACVGAAVDCSTLDDACNAGACDPETGACVASPLADGTACDDGLFCTAADACVAGACTGTQDPCATAGECRSTCSEADDACLDPEGAPCTDDLNPCTLDVCDDAGACTHAPLATVCDDGVFCNGPDACAAGSCSVHLGGACAAGQVCDEEADACADAPCVPLSLPPHVACVTDRECTVPVLVAAEAHDVASVAASLEASLSAECAATCTAGAAAGGATCTVNGSTCTFVTADLEPPVTAFGDGELARIGLHCSESGEGELCMTDATAGTTGGVPAAVCPVACTTLSCGTCLPGDCNGTGSLDAGDPVCTVLCLVGGAPAGADCSCAADCNCLGGTEAGDPICTVLRLIDGFSPDTCAVGLSSLVSPRAEPSVFGRAGALRTLRVAQRRRGFIRLRGHDAERTAAVRGVLSSDAELVRVRLARRLQAAGFSLVVHPSGSRAATFVVMGPPRDDGVAPIGRGRLLRVVVAPGARVLELDAVSLGSTSGLPLPVSSGRAGADEKR